VDVELTEPRTLSSSARCSLPRHRGRCSVANAHPPLVTAVAMWLTNQIRNLGATVQSGSAQSRRANSRFVCVWKIARSQAKRPAAGQIPHTSLSQLPDIFASSRAPTKFGRATDGRDTAYRQNIFQKRNRDATRSV
jgi:hypothetical protein